MRILFLVIMLSCSLAFASDIEISDRDGDRLNIRSDGGLPAKETANTSLGSGYRDVKTAGTAIAASGDVAINRVIIKASLANTGNIYVGDSDVSTLDGYPLDAGEVWIGTVDNLNKIYIDATVSGDSIGFTFEQ